VTLSVLLELHYNPARTICDLSQHASEQTYKLISLI
jgi:hypothetical protein